MISTALRRVGVPVSAIALTVPAIASASTDEPASSTGLEVGRWVANSVLAGVSRGVTVGGPIEFTGRFDIDYEFDVDTGGAAAGSWSSTGNGTNGDRRTPRPWHPATAIHRER